MLTEVFAATGSVAMEKLALNALATTLTLGGTVATELLLLVSVTTAPPDGAGPLRITVPVEAVPPRTEVGFNEPEDRAGAFTVRLAVQAFGPYVADTVTDVFVPTGTVVTLKVALVAFAGIVTLAGTVAAEALLLLSMTTAPPTGAGLSRVTVPAEAVPPVTEVGFRDTEFRIGGVTVNTAAFALAP